MSACECCKQKSLNMLNIIPGTVCKVKLFSGWKKTVKVLSKIVHSDTIHAYLVTHYSEQSHPYSVWIWDYGLANSNREVVHNQSAISNYEALSKGKYCPECFSEAINPCGRGGKRCYCCGKVFDSD